MNFYFIHFPLSFFKHFTCFQPNDKRPVKSKLAIPTHKGIYDLNNIFAFVPLYRENMYTLYSAVTLYVEVASIERTNST